MISVHRSVSLTITLPYSAGVIGTVTVPCWANNPFIFGSFKPALIAAFSLLMTSGVVTRGVPHLPNISLITRNEFADRWNVRTNFTVLRSLRQARAACHS